jgi:hypothetical protein
MLAPFPADHRVYRSCEKIEENQVSPGTDVLIFLIGVFDSKQSFIIQ